MVHITDLEFDVDTDLDELYQNYSFRFQIFIFLVCVKEYFFDKKSWLHGT